MTAMTAAHAARAGNPPLPFTRNAIVDQLRRQATNGPAYVQHSATRALAQLKGLYAEARYEARLAFERAKHAALEVKEQAKEQAGEQKMSFADRIAGLMDGSLEPTPEELAHFQRDKPLDEDEDHETEPNDEPP